MARWLRAPVAGETGRAVARPPSGLSAFAYSAQAAAGGTRVHASDRRLDELVDAARPHGSGIGGRSALLKVGGKPVFVKRVPLTDMERLPEHARSTANLFGMPTFCQYGVGGGPGFGAWRELAVHTMTTNWVLGGQYQGFPMMYDWRVLPGTAALPEELADVDRVVAYWGGSPEVRRRIEALEQSSASLALFLEYIPSDARRVAHRAGTGWRRVCRPGLFPGGGRVGGRHVLHERSRASALRRPFSEHPGQRPTPLLHRLRPRHLVPIRSVPVRGPLSSHCTGPTTAAIHAAGW